MKIEVLVCMGIVLLLVFLLVRCSDRNEHFTNASGICFTASQNGADDTFVGSCTTYQKLCGESSTAMVVQQINGEVGLNSDQADTMMQTSLSLAQQNKSQCCDPNDPDTSFCTGNTD